MVQAHDDRVRASLDIQVSQRNPTAILEDSMTSVNTLYVSSIESQKGAINIQRSSIEN